MTVHNPADVELVADAIRAGEYPTAAAFAVLDALSSRLLPRDGEERTEWRVVFGRVGRWADGADTTLRQLAEEWLAAARREGLANPRLESRTVTSYPDGRVVTSAWKEIGIDGN